MERKDRETERQRWDKREKKRWKKKERKREKRRKRNSKWRSVYVYAHMCVCTRVHTCACICGCLCVWLVLRDGFVKAIISSVTWQAHRTGFPVLSGYRSSTWTGHQSVAGELQERESCSGRVCRTLSVTSAGVAWGLSVFSIINAHIIRSEIRTCDSSTASSLL